MSSRRFCRRFCRGFANVIRSAADPYVAESIGEFVAHLAIIAAAVAAVFLIALGLSLF